MMKPYCLPMLRIRRHVGAAGGLLGAEGRQVALGVSGRQRLNIHGAIDLETGTTRMIEATTIDALSTIALFMWRCRR